MIENQSDNSEKKDDDVSEPFIACKKNSLSLRIRTAHRHRSKGDKHP